MFPFLLHLLEVHCLQHHGQITPLSVACTIYSHEPAQVSLQTLCLSENLFLYDCQPFSFIKNHSVSWK